MSSPVLKTADEAPEDAERAIHDLQYQLKQALLYIAEIETSEADELRLAKDQRLVDLEAEVAMANRKVVELEMKLKGGNQVRGFTIWGLKRRICTSDSYLCSLPCTGSLDREDRVASPVAPPRLPPAPPSLTKG